MIDAGLSKINRHRRLISLILYLSLVYILKRSGAKIDPWGKALLMARIELDFLLNTQNMGVWDARKIDGN